jgi:hypothetical protein
MTKKAMQNIRTNTSMDKNFSTEISWLKPNIIEI